MRIRPAKNLSFGSLLLLGYLLLFSGCTATTSAPPAPLEIFWPPHPAPAQIQWVGEIHGAQQAGIAKGFWTKMVQHLTGSVDDEIRKPYGIFVDRSDRLFVADPAAKIVHLFDRPGKRYLAIGNGKDKALQTPIGVTGDGDDTLFITDAGAATVFRYRIGKKVLAPFLAGKLKRPTGIAYNHANHLLYVTDTAAHQVVVFDLEGQERFRIGSRGEAPGTFNYPTDLSISAGGDLYVTDPLNARIQSFSADGNFLGEFSVANAGAGYTAKPKGIALDGAGRVYVVDALLDSVQIYDRAGNFLLSFGARGTEAGKFWMPAGLFIDSNDVIYVADSYNRRLQVFRYLKTPGAAAGGPEKTGGRP